MPFRGEFSHGEFSRRFKIQSNILELTFHNHIDWKVFAFAFMEINKNILSESDNEIFLKGYYTVGEEFIVLRIEYPIELREDYVRRELVECYRRFDEMKISSGNQSFTNEFSFERMLLPFKSHDYGNSIQEK